MVGIKPKEQVFIKWSSDFAYAVGLIVTDGSLSKDGRHIIFVSKDLDLIENFQVALRIKANVSGKIGGYNSDKRYYVIQNRRYRFLSVFAEDRIDA